MEPKSENGGQTGSVTRRWRKRLAQALAPDSQSTFFPPPPPALMTGAIPASPSTARVTGTAVVLPPDPELTCDQAEALRDKEAAFEPGGVYPPHGMQEPGRHT